MLDLDSPIIICGQGGSRTRLIAQIFELLEDSVQLPSSTNTKDNLFLREIECHYWEQCAPIFQKKTMDYKITNSPVDIDNLIKLTQFKKKCKTYLHNMSRNLWGFKEPRIRYFLPYFYKLFPKMKVIYVYRKTVPSKLHFEGMPKTYELLMGDKPYPRKIRNFKIINCKIDKDVNHFLIKNKIPHIVIDTDLLVSQDSVAQSTEICRLLNFFQMSENNKEYYLKKIPALINPIPTSENKIIDNFHV